MSKNENRPLSEKTLQSRTNGRYHVPREVWNILKASGSVIFDDITRTYSFKPAHNVRDKAALLVLLKSKRGQDVVAQDYKELKEGWPDILPAVQELEREGQIIVFRGKDGSPKHLYWNDTDLNVKVDSEFQKYWNDVKIPTTALVDNSELAKMMADSGLKGIEVMHTAVKQQVKPKSKKRSNKRIKITNTHLAPLDYSKDLLSELK
ncbi:hypothetical protein HK097_005962 [Rhizophlyctis rosea]|uniref:Transcription initiation factor IIE subunit beta n=1 Tax=Rhizophlyctis rosea TaxID=64517 RepID=A0AAD5X4S3_9FUNG|nr:hypothetical protein HK097_005962 [Rhizophlyctis rosea]